MNYLAHLYLSGDNEELLFGNFIADHVKGSVFPQYGHSVQNGIRLHRSIDSFTDSHPVTGIGKKLLYPFAGKYAPVAMDIILDHFLALKWEQFHPLPLREYTEHIYRILDGRTVTMPERTLLMYNYMKRDNWLFNYALPEGVERSLSGLARRSSDPALFSNSRLALKEHYQGFEQVFIEFFPELKKHVEKEILRLNLK